MDYDNMQVFGSVESRKSGVLNALKRTNLSTYQIAEIYNISHEEVLDLMKELDYSVV